ncbi:MAG: guanylate kinase [Proteobacteria bacterium]|nr:guanylate kinase [Pseudomonadota bacterium]
MILSAPSGTGKTSIVRGAQAIFPRLALSVSYTTRNPRDFEQDGVDYFFVSVEKFKERIEKGDFLEWAEVYGNYYGTSKEFINKSQKEGNIVLLDIDVQGAMQLFENEDLEKGSIFIVPPSFEVLKKRLTSRNTETQESLKKRMDNAEHELGFQDYYDFVLINNNLEKAIHKFVSIIIKESLNPGLQGQYSSDQILGKLLGGSRSDDNNVDPTLLKICQQLL